MDDNPLPAMVAARLGDELLKLQSFTSQAQVPTRRRGHVKPDVTFLIVERSFDVPAALLHDVAYQVSVLDRCFLRCWVM